MSLELLDLVPRPYGPYRGARPGAMAAASERNLLEMMMSVGLTAQARMMRTGPARAAEGWSAAEEGVYKAARAFNLLTQSVQRLAKIYASEQRFIEEREFGESKPEPRIDVLAEHALNATDPFARQAILDRQSGDEARDEKIRALTEQNNKRRQDYWDATIARLRELDPDWITLEQHNEALGAAEEALRAAEPSAPQRAPARPPESAAWQQDHHRVRRQPEIDAGEARYKAVIAKMQKRVVVAPPSPAPTSGSTPPLPSETVPESVPESVPEPAPPRKRGAQSGNVLSLKTGRHTAPAKAERAEDAAMLREVRAICAEADELAAELTALNPGAG